MSKESKREKMVRIVEESLDCHMSAEGNKDLLCLAGASPQAKRRRNAVVDAMLTAVCRWDESSLADRGKTESSEPLIWVAAKDLMKLPPALRRGAQSISEQADFAEQRIGGIIGSAAAEKLLAEGAETMALAMFIQSLCPPEAKGE